MRLQVVTTSRIKRPSVSLDKNNVPAERCQTGRQRRTGYGAADDQDIDG